MRVGMPWWIGAGEVQDGIRQARKLGFDFVEVSLDAPWPGGLQGASLREASEENGVALAFHAPWRSQSIAHPRGVLAQAAANVAKECIDLALGSAAEYVVFHVDARDFARYPDPAVVERGLGHARQALSKLAAGADPALAIVVENTSVPLATPDELRAFLEPLPDVAFCYDPGHAALAVEDGVEGASEDASAWFDAVGRRLAVLHLMDVAHTQTGVVDHLVPGAGDLDLERLVELAQGAGCSRVLVEAFYRDAMRTPAAASDLQAARTVVAGLLAR